MNRKVLLLAPVVVVALGVAAWLGWCWYLTPPPPTVSLEGAHPAVVELIEGAREDVYRQPRSGPGWGKLGMIFAAHGFDEQAMVCYSQAQRFEPNNPRWPYLHAIPLLPQNPPAGIALLRRALDLTSAPDERAVILFRLARVLIENDELDDAEGRLQALAAVEPDSPRVRFGLGLLAIAHDDRDQARRDLDSLGDDPFARKQASGLLASMAGADKQMANRYQQRYAALPDDMPWPDPIEEEMRSLKVNRLQRIARFYELQSQGRLTEALDFLRKTVAESPDAEFRLILGLELFRANELDDAIEALRATILVDKHNAKAHLFLGIALCRKGEKALEQPNGKDSARELFCRAVAASDQALAVQGDLAYAHLTRGQALKRLGRTEDALRALRQAVLCQSESAEMHVALGEALAEAGQLPEALEHLENAVRLAGPEDGRAREVLQKWRAKAKSS
jgi:tetratricopeptide (TPR) repeat protein